VLIDTGIGQRSGRQLLQIVQDRGLRLSAIFNTHGHGDHSGGNAYLIEHTGAQVYAPRYDARVLQDPFWGTMCIFGGADPLNELRTPRFSPPACAVDVIVTEGTVSVAGLTLQIIPLPGHTGSHTGYVVNDVFFIGDLLAGEEELTSAPVPYAYSITQRLQSLEKLRQYHCAYYVPGHGKGLTDTRDLIERNVTQVKDVLGFIQGLLAKAPLEAAEIVHAVCAHYGIALRDVREYYLLYPTLLSFLSHLSNSGAIRPKVQDNRLLWHIAEGGSPC
jgi:glyoxylase-like metal-dependent hydrolase (beta-lactamase superfamily II)